MEAKDVPGSARGLGSARPSARGSEEAKLSARLREEAKGTIGPATDVPGITARVQAMDTSRDFMSTARMHTALAALTAERTELLNKLAFIDSTLEAEGRKKLGRTRGFIPPSHIK
jgi:hypothetical protein